MTLPTVYRLQGLLAKDEITELTDAVPTAATNGLRLAAPATIELGMEYPNERPDVVTGGLFTAPPAVPRGRWAKITVPWELRGEGDAYADGVIRPEAAPLLTAAGCTETFDATVGDEKAIYTQGDGAFTSCTIYAYAEGWLFKVVGCRGKITAAYRVGQKLIVTFEMWGLLAADPVATALPAITYTRAGGDILPPTAANAGVTLDPTGTPWAPQWDSIDFDAGLEPTFLGSGNATDALLGVSLVRSGDGATLSLTAYTPTSGYDAFGDLKDRIAKQIDVPIGATQFNRATLSGPAAYLKAPPQIQELNQHAGWRLDYLLTGSPMFTLTFD